MHPAGSRAGRLHQRTRTVNHHHGEEQKTIHCTNDSLAGSVSQRACVFCGARVVLNPVTDAVHLVHGPIGCATYTWDIRGSLSSGSEMYRNSFSTDMKERDVIFGGEKKLAACIDEIVAKYHPPAIFVYATCVAGMIGDDIIAVCKEASHRHGIDVIPVESSGFISGNKVVGYRAAAEALLKLITPERRSSGRKDPETQLPRRVQPRRREMACRAVPPGDGH